MSVDTKENDLLNKTDDSAAVEQDSTHPLHILQQAIANMPGVDAEKVQAVLAKLKSGSIQILGSEEERLESAKRIAKQIMAETAKTDE
ncbi:MAG TPA: hypothetical protein VLG38_03675 [Gammaproteobacteria bacterium]|nr:hypothetical protein [Gammaproteobacteria bacterium]